MKFHNEKNASPLSVMSRIRNQAREMGADPAKLAQRYVFERFLLRLSQTPEWRERMALKGANALIAITRDMARTTEDLDMWAIDPLTADEAVAMFKAVAAAKTPDVDPIVFDVDNILIKPINEISEEPGHQLSVVAKIGDAKIHFKLEVTHGSATAPQPLMMDYPTTFDGDTAPRIMAYNPATIVAEKLHAMVKHGDRGTRIKDFYDVAALMKGVEMSGVDLVAALRATFTNCKTDIPDPAAKLPVFDTGYAKRGEQLWRSWADDKFGRNPNYKKQSFADPVAVIEPFLMKCCSMALEEGDVWDWRGRSWIDTSPRPAMGM